MTAALEGVGGQQHAPAALYARGKTLYPFYRRLGGPQCRSGRSENLVPTGIRSWTVQPVVSRYTDWATGPTQKYVFLHICNSFTIYHLFIILVTLLWQLIKLH